MNLLPMFGNVLSTTDPDMLMGSDIIKEANECILVIDPAITMSGNAGLSPKYIQALSLSNDEMDGVDPYA